MDTVFFIGNIGSGKSTATRHLEARGARRIDLDELAKGLYASGSAIVDELASEFGWDIVDEDGAIARAVLAERAFATPEATGRLDAIVHPAVLARLGDILLPAACCAATPPSYPLTVVEVSAPAAFRDAFALADEIVAITAPYDVRRRRALGRGMSADDFDRRSAVQPDEGELCALASTVIDNEDPLSSFIAQVDAWAAARGIELDEVPADGGSDREGSHG